MTRVFDNIIKHILNESYTISIADVDDETPKDLGELAWKLNDLFHKHMLKNGFKLETYPEKLRGEKIVVDGDSDYFGTKGILSFYSDQVPDNLIENTIKMLVYYIPELSADLNGKPYVETSGLTRKDVWRFNVTLTPPKNPAPEINLANTNARVVFVDLLNYPSDMLDDYPRIRINELLMKLEQIEDNDYAINKSKRDFKQSGNMIESGLSSQRIVEIINILKQICEWGLENAHTYIQIS